MTVPVIVELLENLATISDAEMRRNLRNLDPVAKNEKTLGTVNSREAQCIWCLNSRYAALAITEKTKATFQADSEIEQKEALVNAARAVELRDLCTHLFWVQAKDDVGAVAWEADGDSNQMLGIRENFMLVAFRRRKHPLEGIIGAPIQLEGGGE